MKGFIPLLEKKNVLHSKWEVIQCSLITRLIFVCAMVLSCALLPNFDPGHDVLQFDMRLKLSDNAFEAATDGGICFCLEGHACVRSLSSSTISSEVARRNPVLVGNRKCLDTMDNPVTPTNAFSVNIYNILLSPFTRWDAARFLTLAADPYARFPNIPDDVRSPECTVRNINQDSSNDVCQIGRDDWFRYSEQAHAFFPLFPLIVRHLSLVFLRIIPHSFLPPTFEALLVLSAILWNVFAFTISALALQSLTFLLIRVDDQRVNGEERATEAVQKDCIHLANLVTVVYCLNPATIFFVTCYSESTFSLFSFAGYLCFQKSRIAFNQGAFGWLGWLSTSTILWMMASWTRSNGSLISVFIFIHLCGMILNYEWGSVPCLERYVVIVMMMKILGTILIYSCSILCVFMPMFVHDRSGMDVHCKGATEFKPEWCKLVNGDSASVFSLYQHVQKVHWNVGFMNYWEIKQVPNFLLAMPILFLSFYGVKTWIGKSWNDFLENESMQEATRLSVVNVLKWSLDSLSKLDHAASSNFGMKESDASLYRCLVGSNMLGYYTMLAGFAFLGAFIAHVQISTRMICSACPAVYWFMIFMISCPKAGTVSREMKEKIFICYLLLFHALSVLLHVNWLPWT